MHAPPRSVFHGAKRRTRDIRFSFSFLGSLFAELSGLLAGQGSGEGSLKGESQAGNEPEEKLRFSCRKYLFIIIIMNFGAEFVFCFSFFSFFIIIVSSLSFFFFVLFTNILFRHKYKYNVFFASFSVSLKTTTKSVLFLLWLLLGA